MKTKRRIAWLSAVLLAGAPLAAQAQTTPPPSRARPAPETDEGGLWGLFDRVEGEARNSAQRNTDPALNAYVQGLACKLAVEFCGDIRVYVMDRPLFNASMAPNGYMEVWSGLLLRAENEAQAAFVIGHEIAHFRERHSLQRLRAQRDTSSTLLLLSAAIAVAGVSAANNNPYMAGDILDMTSTVMDITYLIGVAQLFGFSREQESEADRIGAELAIAAGYDVRESFRIWELAVDERRHSDHERIRRGEVFPNIYRTHPLDDDRIRALQAIAARQTQTGAAARESYRTAIRPHLDAWLRDELRRRDYGQSLHLIERLARSGEDLGMLNYFRGECFRLRRNEGDLIRARDAYELAIQSADAPPAAWRQLADIYERERRPAEAATQLAIYLERSPDANDRLLVERRLNALRAQTGEQPQ